MKRMSEQSIWWKVLILGAALTQAGIAYAAKAIDLHQQSIASLKATLTGEYDLKQIKQVVDAKNNVHIHVKQVYQGYPVWGGDGVVHVKGGANKPTSLYSILSGSEVGEVRMHGKLYQDIHVDLANSPAKVFTKTHANKVQAHAIAAYQTKVGGKANIQSQENNLIVYIDKNDKAHWAYKISFAAAPAKANSTPTRPVYIVDADSMEIYQAWDDVKALEAATVDSSFDNETFEQASGYGAMRSWFYRLVSKFYS